ncbi:MAG TPA: hypothetical protein VGR91_12655 [Stellaceae bacterium]|nr:hypothetical protein [Stellaceae bacterium]
MTETDPLAYQIDIAHPMIHGDIGYGAMTFWRNRNPNGLAPTVQRDDGGEPWLRLAVAKDAYPGATAGSPETNDRCELRDDKLPLGTPVSYSFEMRAERGFPVVDARCVCAQIKAPYYDADGGSPLFALRIDRGRWVATIEHLYEANDVSFVDGSEVSDYLTPYRGPGSCGERVRAFDHHVFGNSPRDFKELQVRALLATDGGGLPGHLEGEFRSCTSLVAVTQATALPDDIHEWSRFVVRVAPTSVKNEDGILQLLIVARESGEECLIATARGEFGHAGYADPQENTGPAPGAGLQYFKIGPYRDKLRIWGKGPAAIHVRGIRRDRWDDGAKLRRAANERR